MRGAGGICGLREGYRKNAKAGARNFKFEISDLKWLCRHRAYLRGQWKTENVGSICAEANGRRFRRGYARGRSKPRPYRDEKSFVVEEVNRAISNLKFQI